LGAALACAPAPADRLVANGGTVATPAAGVASVWSAAEPSAQLAAVALSRRRPSNDSIWSLRIPDALLSG